MLSLSCGYIEDHLNVQDNMLFWAENFSNVSIGAQQNNADLNLIEKFGGDTSDRYLRLNPKLEYAMELDTTKPDDLNSLLDSAD